MGRPGVGDPRLREPKTKSKMKQKGASGYAGGLTPLLGPDGRPLLCDKAQEDEYNQQD